MHPHTLRIAGSYFVRSTVIASTLIVASSLPSFAIPQSAITSSRIGNSTATQTIVSYGEAPRQLLVIQNPAPVSFTQTAPLKIGRTIANGLPQSLEIGYNVRTVGGIGGGGTSTRTLPQLVLVPQGAQNVGGEINAPVRSQTIQTYEVQTDQGFLDQTTQNVVNFSF